MARRNYLVEGLSGAGKSSVYEELIRRGYHAISTDRAWKDRLGPYDAPMWDEQKAVGELESPEPGVLFVCGSSRNRDRFLPYFTKVFNLRVDDETMRRRLRERINNDFGEQPEEVELMLSLNRSDAEPAPWSKRGSATGRSFVIPESALLGASTELWDVLGRETIARLEYSWSGDVLATLLAYLDAQRIDLMHSQHDQVASAFVLTPAHRERYLARLDPSAFDGAELRRYYEESNDTAAEAVEFAMLDGIAFLRDTLAPLDATLVAVLVIGSSLPRRPTIGRGA